MHSDIGPKKVVMVIAHRSFRDEELLIPKGELEKEGINVFVASTSLTDAVGKLGAVVVPDLLVKDIKLTDFDAIVFVGGIGCLAYWDDPLAHSLLKEAFSAGKIIAGICSGVVILARSGVLRCRKATVFPGDAKEIIDMGAEYTASLVERDGKIITASGPQAAEGFGRELASALR